MADLPRRDRAAPAADVQRHDGRAQFLDVELARRLWQRLLDPTPPATSNTWQIGSGPAVRLVPASENRIQALLIRVASLERAKAFLRKKQLLGMDAAGQVAIDPAKIGGLDLRLVER